MDFIFMLTRDDRTVRDCLELVDSLADVGLRHIGFKDVGVDAGTLAALHRRIRATGATSCLEVVSTSRERALDSARMAVDLGVDQLMGGIWAEETLELLRGTGIRYLPFPGTPSGHPTRLGGTPEQVAEQCRRFEAAGCDGVDLLAYRATDADPMELVRSARAATSGRLVVAGGIDSRERIAALAAAGVDAFTVGSAAMAAAFDPHLGTLQRQLAVILDAAGSSSAACA
ncbi:HisA/HisF-related TIM barrel protein [Streptomyces sp. NPDC054841]